MEDYLIPKANNFMSKESIAQPLTLIPEIAEIDKLSDKGGKGDVGRSPERHQPMPVVERQAPRSVKYIPSKSSYSTPITKGSHIVRQGSPEPPEFASLKAKVVVKLEEKWNLIAQISNIQKEDEKTVEILKKVEAK